MIRQPMIFLLAVLLVTSRGAAAGQERPRLTNKEVVELVKAGLSAEVVIAKIRNSSCNFDTSPETLKQLKAEGIPDSVILAMVEAVVTPPPEEKGQEPSSHAAPSTSFGYAVCPVRGEQKVGVLEVPGNPKTVGQLSCGERVIILTPESKSDFLKVRTDSGVEGFVSHWFLKETPPVPQNSASEVLGANRIRALGYRAIPQQSTAYYRSGEYSGHARCYGSGIWTSFGSSSSLNLTTDCDTTYSNPTDIPITWQFVDVYNLVESDSGRYLIHCRANWTWSKCSPLIPGEVFESELRGTDLWVVGSRDGKKQVKVKYRVLEVVPR